MLPKKSVSYFFDSEIGLYQYANGHPMKPLRVAMTDELIQKYGLYPKMKIYDKSYVNINDEDLTACHAYEYIELIKNVTPENRTMYEDQLYQFNFGEDCPVFNSLYEYCLLYTGGSMIGAKLLNEKKSDIVVNWSGGLHHAKKAEASGFCYINDCVIAILELLKVYERVLYVDIDIHHGDGVEEAFYQSDRVLTFSTHKFGEYFPGTGHIDDKGIERGVNHAVNFPLKDGMDDESFTMIIKPMLQKIIESFKPQAIVLQGGADSLSGDRLGCFNLSIKGHGEALTFLKGFDIPLMLLGGGGYTLRNVPRCWAYETGLALDEDLPNELPENEYLEYFGPEYKLHFPVSNMENKNSREYLEKTQAALFDNLRGLKLWTRTISNYTDDNEVVKMDIEEISKINKDRIEEENIDKHMEKNPKNVL